MSTLGKKPLQLFTNVFVEHRSLVHYCKEHGMSAAHTADKGSESSSAPEDPRLGKLTQSYLKMLGSPNGNDILEEVCVRATGREPKADDTKHGADSADGELEAKPMKTAYNAHISDDTPASLLRHQTIPYILLSEWTKDGVDLLWALTTSYRVFDNSRYRGILATFPAEHQGDSEAAQKLPTDLADRRRVLEELVVLRERFVKERNIPRYVRSNPLPVEDLANLQPGQYCVWASPALEKSRGKAHKVIWALWKAQRDPFVLDEAFVAGTEAIRDHFATTSQPLCPCKNLNPQNRTTR